MAAIGEQFMEALVGDDDIFGISVSPREKDDLIQVWNIRSAVAADNKVLEKIHSLLPDVRFMAEFYKRKAQTLSPGLLANLNPALVSAHQTHTAFEGARRAY